jgi:hypothetical protein
MMTKPTMIPEIIQRNTSEFSIRTFNNLNSTDSSSLADYSLLINVVYLHLIYITGHLSPVIIVFHKVILKDIHMV